MSSCLYSRVESLSWLSRQVVYCDRLTIGDVSSRFGSYTTHQLLFILFNHPYMIPPVLPAVEMASHTTSSSSSIPISSTLPATSSPDSEMKDVSNSHRAARPSAYPKKKPSPYGITKSSKRQSPAYGHSPIRKTPRAKVEVMVQRQRYLHLTLRRDGVILEEEYHEEIRAYMHEMEVSPHRIVLPRVER